MAWGARSGVDDLLQRLQQPKTGKNLCVLSFRKLSPADVRKLAAAITHNEILEELYLSGHQLGADGIQAFADALALNKTLHHLSIGDDALGDDAVVVLAAALARNVRSAVASWDLEHKSLGAAGARAVGELLATSVSLNELNLARNALHDQGVKLLVDGLSRNETSSLRTLTLMETSVSGVALDHLAALLRQPTCSLQTLQLSFNNLSCASDSFFAALGKNKSLQHLYLKEAKLTVAHAMALAEALKSNTTLIEVDVSDNALSSDASVSFADALKVNKTLKRLVLGGNKCCDEGAVALGEVLRASNASLEFLDLANNQLSHVGIVSLLAAGALKSLRLFNNKLATGLPHVLPALVANRSLESLDVGANALHGELSIELFDQLHDHTTLTTLEMGGNSLGDDGHAALERLKAANPKLDVAADKNAQNEEDGLDA